MESKKIYKYSLWLLLLTCLPYFSKQFTLYCTSSVFIVNKVHFCYIEYSKLVTLNPWTISYDEKVNKSSEVCTASNNRCANGSCEYEERVKKHICKCSKIDGYSYKYDSATHTGCKTVGPKGCIFKIYNGTEYKCQEGYREYAINNNLCQPICSEPCESGTCMGPEKCECDDGYQLSPHDRYLCLPVCSQGCVNGECIAPEACLCDDGYEKDPDRSHICRPTCSEPCEFGNCIAPDECQCFYGYKLSVNDSLICEPVCSNECQFGECVGPDKCKCHSGYRLSAASDFICQPIDKPQPSNTQGSLFHFIKTIVIIVLLFGVISGLYLMKRERGRFSTVIEYKNSESTRSTMNSNGPFDVLVTSG